MDLLSLNLRFGIEYVYRMIFFGFWGVLGFFSLLVIEEYISTQTKLTLSG